MSEQRWERLKRVFQEAIERAPSARPAFLAEACGDDGELLRDVESMLTSHDAAGGFLEAPAASLAAEPGSWIGRRIGAYRILDEIGRGGMGRVYGAVRDDDAFRLQVAVKIVRGGFDSEEGVRRFRRERQILARLQHPNIATLLDGGATEEGQPYLVMERVAGQPLDAYCATRGLGVRERLHLFRTVCSAVHYAHQNLVVHRDLKPGNILVTSEGVPKLLDFGISKLLAPDEDMRALPTATLLPALTPEYASPEQVRGEPVATTSDVYALGVVLYELLAGRRPYEIETRTPEEVLRIVGHTEPEKPSTTARRMPTGPIAHSELSGDLDTIVLKCLRKEPGRRYASAQELSEDLRRYLDGLPVKARPDTLGYRASKFAGRHRFGIAAAALLVVSLVGGIAATWMQARIAEANRVRAERRFNDVRKLANTLMFDIHDEIRSLPGSTRARQRLVLSAQEYLDSLAREAQGDPGLQRELAAAYERLGDVQGGGLESNLGDTRAALASYRRALAIREALGKGEPPSRQDARATAHLQAQLATLFSMVGDLPSSERTLQAAATILEALPGGPASDTRLALASTYQKLANAQSKMGKPDAAAGSVRKAIRYGEEHLREHPGDAGARLTLAASYYEDGALLLRVGGRREEALARMRQARGPTEELIRTDPLNNRHRRLLLHALNGEGRALETLGRRDEALSVYRHGVHEAEEMVRRDPADRYALVGLSVACSSLGRALVNFDLAARAVPVLRSGRQTAARVVAQDPNNGFARNELAVIDYNLARALLTSAVPSDRAEACRLLGNARENWTRLRDEGPGEATEGLSLVEQQRARCP